MSDLNPVRHAIIGTAGHVDHGKTWLTRALTGVDTDRLEEEKRRGMTIDLGFAPLTLPDGKAASIIDVPGHEHLVRTMICGASGIDLVLLVVAADEGFMPQTQEHLDVLQTLGVRSGVVVLTKVDLVDEEWLQAVMEDTREHVAGTFLEEAPLVCVSAVTGQGLDELRNLIARMLEDLPLRRMGLPFRLPVDRAFSVRGFGTVATGSLVDGRVTVGDLVEILPQGIRSKVRGLQTHGSSEGEAFAGMRVAINLADVSVDELGRGATLAVPGSMQLARQVAVRLELVADAPFDVRNSSQLHVYAGTQELVARVRLLDRDVLHAGESCMAQLTFQGEICFRPQDRFVVRFFSPVITVGGGAILEETRRKLKRNDSTVLARLEALAGEPRTRARQVLVDAGARPLSAGELARRAGLSLAEARNLLPGMVQGGGAVALGGGCYADVGAVRCLAERATRALEAHQGEHPLEPGMDLDAFRQGLLAASRQGRGAGAWQDGSFSEGSSAADLLVSFLMERGVIEVSASLVRTPGFAPRLTSEQEQVRTRLLVLYEEAGLEPPLNEEVLSNFAESLTMTQEVLAYLVREGELVQLSASRLVGRAAYQKAYGTLKDMFDQSETLALADYRTRLGVSRRIARQYLEHFDAMGLTRLVGEARVLVASL